MGYNIAIEKLDEIKPDYGKRLDPFIVSALVGNFNFYLPQHSAMTVVLNDWYTACVFAKDLGGVCDFYASCPTEDAKEAVKLLKKYGFGDLAYIIKRGVSGYKSAKKNNEKYAGWRNDCIFLSENWIEQNEKRFHKLLSGWVKSEADILKKVFASSRIPFDEACYKNANTLRDMGDNDTAIMLFKYAAEAGNARAMFDVSEYYEIVEDDPRSAVKWCIKSAQAGCAEAQFKYSQGLLEGGKGMEAFEWCKKAAEQYHPLAMRELGVMYSGGVVGVKGIKNDELAFEWLQKAAEEGVMPAYDLLASYYEKGVVVEKDHNRAIEYYSVAAVSGSGLAREKLRRFPSMQDYMKKSDEIKKRADQGDAYAAYALGCFAESEENDELSEKYFKQAVDIWKEKADSGNLEAQTLLGMCYNDGKGVEENCTMAYNLFTQAESGGYAFATYCIAQMYNYGEAVKYSPKTANEYYIKAAEKGVVEAMMYLGRNYDDGCGIKKDYKKAQYWLERAANEGEETCAHRCLAHMYDTVLNDPEKAREWRIKAAEQGDRTAQVWLARGVFKDRRDYLQQLKEFDVEQSNSINGRLNTLQQLEECAKHYEYTEYYDSIFEKIKSHLPYDEHRE